MTETRRRPARSLLSAGLFVLALPMVVHAAGRWWSSRVDSGDESSATLRRLALMNGVDLELTSLAFRHARFDLGMGGINVDLTGAELDPEGATIELHGAMGGLNLTVPAAWRVTVNALSSTVGVNQEPQGELAVDAPSLHLDVHARMSGVNVDTA